MPKFMVVALKCGLIAAKIAKIYNFWYKFALKGYIPLNDFYKIWYREGVPGPHYRAKFHQCHLKYGLTAPKIAKIIFGINFPKRGTSC